jgi:hypothetical protein
VHCRQPDGDVAAYTPSELLSTNTHREPHSGSELVLACLGRGAGPNLPASASCKGQWQGGSRLGRTQRGQELRVGSSATGPVTHGAATAACGHRPLRNVARICGQIRRTASRPKVVRILGEVRRRGDCNQVDQLSLSFFAQAAIGMSTGGAGTSVLLGGGGGGARGATGRVRVSDTFS